MAESYTCRQGHRWEASPNRGAVVRCPVCGGAARKPQPPEAPAGPHSSALPTVMQPRKLSDSELDLYVPPPPGRDLDSEPDVSLPPLLGQSSGSLHPSAADPGPAHEAPPATVRANFPAPDTDAATVGAGPERVRLRTKDLDAPTQRPGPPPCPPSPHLPAVPGYEVLQLLGRGGMGVVYKARQLSLNRLVALKMILGGAHASPTQLARFHIEAEALANLQHPNIVQVYEVGEHDGRPYYSLEFVDGGSLDAGFAGQPQPPRRAAELVETLARAMHAAHLRGIVHRDLKPANVLLTKDGVPKITDFGLAKRLEGPDSHTRTGVIMGTPNYMAPEQAVGHTRDVTPAADTYALGAILYELLTGRPPFDGSTTLEILDRVRHHEPLPPSRQHRRLPRDLETICLKCLSKEPARRYASAEALADDLRRFLADEPIQARPVSRAERAVKWARRRPALAALVLVVGLAALLLAAGGLAYTVRVRAERDRAEKNLQRAERNFERVRRAVDGLLTEVGEELAAEPRMELKRQRLLRRALELYEELLQEEGDDPDVRKFTALAAKGHADILRMLGQHAEARRDYDRAITLLGQLADESPNRPEYRQALADAHNWRGELLRTHGDPIAKAEADYHRARELQQRLADEFPDRPEYRKELARTHYNLGLLVKRNTGRLQEAEESFERAIGLLADLAQRYPDETYRQELARSHLNIGTVLRMTGRGDQAEGHYSKAIELLEALEKQAPKVPEYRYELGVCYNNRGNVRGGQKRFGEAARDHDEALDRVRKLADQFPHIRVYRHELANTHNSRGVLFANTDKPAAAGQEWRQARALYEKLLEDFPGVADQEAGLGQVLGNLGWLATTRDDLPANERDTEARRLLEQGVGYVEKALPRSPENPSCLEILYNQHDDLADALERLGETGKAARSNFLAAHYRLRYMPIALQNRRLSEEERSSQVKKLADPAMERLQKAVRQGFAERKTLEEDPLFQPLRPRPDFIRLLEELPKTSGGGASGKAGGPPVRRPFPPAGERTRPSAS